MPLSNLSFHGKFSRRKENVVPGKENRRHTTAVDMDTVGSPKENRRHTTFAGMDTVDTPEGEIDWLNDIPAAGRGMPDRCRTGLARIPGGGKAASPSYAVVHRLSRRTSCPVIKTSAVYTEVKLVGKTEAATDSNTATPTASSTAHKSKKPLAQLRGMWARASSAFSFDTEAVRIAAEGHYAVPPPATGGPLPAAALDRYTSFRDVAPGDVEQHSGRGPTREPRATAQGDRALAHSTVKTQAADLPLMKASFDRSTPADRSSQCSGASRNDSLDSARSIAPGNVVRNCQTGAATDCQTRQASISNSTSDRSMQNCRQSQRGHFALDSESHVRQPLVLSSSVPELEDMTENPLYGAGDMTTVRSHSSVGLRSEGSEEFLSSGVRSGRSSSDDHHGSDDMTNNPLYNQPSPSCVKQRRASSSILGQSGVFERSRALPARPSLGNVYNKPGPHDPSPARQPLPSPEVSPRPFRSAPNTQVGHGADSRELPHHHSTDSAPGNLADLSKMRRFNSQLSSSDEGLAVGGSKRSEIGAVYMHRAFHGGSSSSDSGLPGYKVRGSASSIVSSISSTGSVVSRFQDLPEDDSAICNEEDIFGMFTLLEKTVAP